MGKALLATLEILRVLGFEEFYTSVESQDSDSNKENKTSLVSGVESSQEKSSSNVKEEQQKEKFQLLKDLFNKNKDCCRCDLCHSRTNIVFYDGDPNSKIMFVGEAPGEEEDKVGKPFVGRAGQYLNKVLEKVGLKRDQIYITNVCKCRPPGNRKPYPKEMQACINTFLKKELQIVKPKVVCCLGATAAEAFLGKKVKITKMRGKFYPNPLYPGSKLFLTYHPAYILRNMREAKVFEEDLRKLKEFLEKS